MQYWSCLDESSLVTYQNKVFENSEMTLSHAHNFFRNYKIVFNKLVKQIGHKELKFYKHFYPFLHEFQEFIPSFYGIARTNKGSFLML